VDGKRVKLLTPIPADTRRLRGDVAEDFETCKSVGDAVSNVAPMVRLRYNRFGPFKRQGGRDNVREYIPSSDGVCR